MQYDKGEGQLARSGDTTELKLDQMAIIARGLFEYSDMFNLERDGVIKRLLNTPGASVLDIPASTSTFGFQLRRMAERASAGLTVCSADVIFEPWPGTTRCSGYDRAARVGTTHGR